MAKKIQEKHFESCFHLFSTHFVQVCSFCHNIWFSVSPQLLELKYIFYLFSRVIYILNFHQRILFYTFPRTFHPSLKNTLTLRNSPAHIQYYLCEIHVQLSMWLFLFVCLKFFCLFVFFYLNLIEKCTVAFRIVHPAVRAPSLKTTNHCCRRLCIFNYYQTTSEHRYNNFWRHDMVLSEMVHKLVHVCHPKSKASNSGRWGKVESHCPSRTEDAECYRYIFKQDNGHFKSNIYG